MPDPHEHDPKVPHKTPQPAPPMPVHLPTGDAKHAAGGAVGSRTAGRTAVTATRRENPKCA